MKNFTINEFSYLNNPRHNPMQGSYVISQKQNSIRFGFDYTNETDFIGSNKYFLGMRYNVDYQLAYSMHSPVYEQNYEEDITAQSISSWGRNALQTMGLGFRARMEGLHDFFHYYLGEYNFWHLGDLSIF